MSDPFDLNTASVDVLCERFPTLGLFCAEDIVAWREKNGPFTSREPLIEILGDAELAATLAAQFSGTTGSTPAAHHAEGEEGSGVVVEAISETVLAMPELPSSAPSPPAPVVPSTVLADEPAARVEAPEPPRPPQSPFSIASAPVPRELLPPPLPKPTRRIGGQTIALTVLVMANVGFAAGLTSLRHDEQQARVPVAVMSSEVQKLRSTQTNTQSEVDESRSRLDEHDTKLAKATQRLDAYEAQQRDAERASKDRDERAAKELAAIGARMGNLERSVDINVHSLDDAIKIVNLAAVREPRVAHSATPEPPSQPFRGSLRERE